MIPKKGGRLTREAVKGFFKKYFLQGQQLEESALIEVPEDASWHQKILIKYRKYIGLLIPAVFAHIIWWNLAFKYDFFSLFPDRYFISITMIFGALVAGLTCEGGGAVAFPVMTLAFNIHPDIARDFSMMIQSCVAPPYVRTKPSQMKVRPYGGMTAATFTIFWMKVQIDWHSIILSSIGGVFGLILGLQFVADHVSSDLRKMIFVCFWTSFAFALFLLNRRRKRETFPSISNPTWWKLVILILVGVLGGFMTSLAGSGMDICSFSFLTLLFMVSEKVATPTSVVLMAINSLVGFFWRHYMMQAVSDEAWRFLAVAAEVVVICAPLGSLIGSHFHRQTLACLVYCLEIAALIIGFVVVRPGLVLSIVSVGILLGGSFFFWILSTVGLWIARKENGIKDSPITGSEILAEEKDSEEKVILDLETEDKKLQTTSLPNLA